MLNPVDVAGNNQRAFDILDKEYGILPVSFFNLFIYYLFRSFIIYLNLKFFCFSLY